MGIIVREDQFKNFGNAPLVGDGITHTYTVKFNQNIKPLIFRFFSGWKKTDHNFTNRKYFENLLITESKKWNNPIKINWIK